MPTAPRRRRRAASSGLWAQKKTPTAVDAFALNENENVRAFPALIMPIPVDIRGFSSTSPASPGLSRFLNYPVPLQSGQRKRMEAYLAKLEAHKTDFLDVEDTYDKVVRDTKVLMP